MSELLGSIKELKPIAIIGAGSIVRDAHLPAYQKAGFKVLALYDKDHKKAEELASQFNIKHTFRNLKELVDFAKTNECLFDIALPASAIIPVIERLPEGSGVLIQKPMGEDLDEANEIVTICRQRNFIAGINFQLRHAPYIQEAQKIISEGLIGELHDIDVRMNIYTPWHLWDFLFQVPRVEILYHSIHYIDMIRYFLGNPQSVYAKTIKHPNSKKLASTRSSIIMDYGEFIRANINTNHGHNFGSRHQESYFKFEGTEGAIKIKVGLYLNYPDGVPDEFEFTSLKDDKGWQSIKLDGSWFPEAFIGPMAGLMLKTETPDFEYINSVEDAIDTMRVVEACYRSSEYGFTAI